jgi:hypothetical protein
LRVNPYNSKVENSNRLSVWWSESVGIRSKHRLNGVLN